MGDDATRPAGTPVWRALVLSRGLVLLAGALAWWLVGAPDGRPEAFDPSGLTRGFGALGDALVAPSARWDATWFLDIAASGYGADEARPAFFPLYPLLVSAGGAVLGSDLAAAIALSLACLAGALVLLHRLTALELDRRAADATVWLVALGPMSFFFSAVYSEALFLLLSVGCCYAARRDRWLVAGLLGALAASTRSAGILLVVPFVLLAWPRGARRPRVEARYAALVPLGLLAFCLHLERTGAGFSAAFDAQAIWFREFAGPLSAVWQGAEAAWEGARQLLSGSRTPVYFEQAGGDPFAVGRQNLMLFAFLLASVPALVGALRRLPLAYGAYAIAALGLALSYPVGPQPLMSYPRFLVVVFPLWMWLGWWCSRPAGRRRLVVTCTLSGVLLVVFTGMFATWRFVA